MSNYKKPYLSFQEQLDLLKSRGLEITNDAIALEYLQRLGYYRLSGYWFPCRKSNFEQGIKSKLNGAEREDNFMPEAKFQDIVDLYVFDKKLRLFILDAIERLEVAFRVDIAYILGAKDPFAYMVPELLHGNFTKKIDPKTGKTKYQEWIIKHNQLILRSKEDFVKHYKIKYGQPLPIWVSIELWDFGLLSTFYQGMAVTDKKEIALKYGIPDWTIMESWLRSLNYLRNVSAHHSRLWNRNLIDQPKLGKKGQIPMFSPYIGNIHITSRVYILISILKYFIEQISPRSSWSSRLVDLLKIFPQTKYFKMSDMGFPPNWDR